MDTQNAAKSTSEFVEEVLVGVRNGSETVPDAVKNNTGLFVAGCVGGVLLGFGIGYFVATKIQKTKFEKMLEDELATARSHYDRLYKKGDFSDPVVLTETLGIEVEEQADDEEVISAALPKARDITESEGYVSYDKVEPQSEEEVIEVVESIATVNVFENNSTVTDDLRAELNMEAEKSKKHRGLPFIITKDDFFHNDQEYSELSFTYFEGDQVLADDQDRAINQPAMIVGIDNLMFGQGSGDPNIVYIQNDRRGEVIEIRRSDGKYAWEVLGEDTVDSKPNIKKFRSSE